MSFVAISGSIIGLSCVPITQLPPSAANLEFPLFLNGLASTPVQIAVQKGGLPHGLYSFLLNHPLLAISEVSFFSFTNVWSKKGSRIHVFPLHSAYARQLCNTSLWQYSAEKWYSGWSFLPFPWLKTSSYCFAALEELGNLNSLDVAKVYVHSLDNDKTGGEFLVHDERLGKRFHVKSTFPQVTIMPPHVLKCISSAF